jgi:glycosyltransferase involved in cell wall biosynthesis
VSTIWIVSEYASTPATGRHPRPHHFARELAARGHRVRLIAASWHHLLREGVTAEAAPPLERIDGYDFVRIPMPRYAHSHDKRRVLNWLLFAWRVTELHRRLPERPDVIMCSSPALFAFLGAERLARRFGARLVFEVRDIWPLTLVELGSYSPRHPMIMVMQWVEDRAYRQSDEVISVLPGAVDHMVARGMERRKFNWIPNGFSKSDDVVPTDMPTSLRDSLPNARFVVGYIGTLGRANALDNLLSAAERLRDQTDIAFVLVGPGLEKDRLQAETTARGLENVHFIDAVPKAMVQSMLADFDACYIGWLESSLYRFGISANKLYDYLYSGRPIVHAFSGGYDPVEAYGAGVTGPAENPSALSEAILKLRDLPLEERRRMGENGRRAALEHHEYGMLALRLEGVLLGSAEETGHADPVEAP